MFIDVHGHIDTYSPMRISEIIEECRKKKVGIILNNGVNNVTNVKTLELSKKYSEIKSALGLYPVEALTLSEKTIDAEILFIEKNKKNVSAIGEVGIDLKEAFEIEKQKEIFRKFISLSMKLNVPVIVHSRQAEKECIAVLEEEKATKVVMHCFSGSMKLVKKIVENGWSLSIPASVKYNGHFQKVVEISPIENLLCETDSPYLHPDREKNNTPANVVESYKKIAEIKKMKLKDVEKKIEENYFKLFGNK